MAVNHPTRIASEYVFESGTLHKIACFEFPDMPNPVRAAYETLSFIQNPDGFLERFLERFLGDNAKPAPDPATAGSRLRLTWLVSLMTRKNLIALECVSGLPGFGKRNRCRRLAF